MIMVRKVYLVGAGPGDPDLITVKGLGLIERADILIYDRLAGEELLSHAKPGAELIYVGKRTGAHTYTQEEINRLLVEKAAEGKVVVRLKGGDPFVFGRGGEEARVLREHGIEFEVVPGVTSAIAVPGLANIPVTDRRYASSFTVVTGQEDPTKGARLDYGALKADTIVILMGMGNLSGIIEQLKRARGEGTPAAIIEKGATEEQRVVVGTLGDILAREEREGIGPPAIVVVGEVVRLREELR
ncbi:MAG: uroporphyrinogen-III C-methyltransferase [Candidatus Hydrothermarchaeota archaeon]